MLRFGHIEIFVTDVKRAQEFYTGILGFDLVDTQDDQFVWLRAGEMELLLRPGSPPKSPLTYREAASAVVLYTHDLAATKERLEVRGLRFLGTDGSPGCLTFQDPEGNWLQLVNPDDH